MIPRERVLAAFKHRESDRTPIFEKLIKPPTSDLLLGRPYIASNYPAMMDMMCEASWEELVEREARDLVDLYQMLGLDMIPLSLNIVKNFERPKKLGKNCWEQGNYIIEFFPKGGYIKREPIPKGNTFNNSLSSEERPFAIKEEEFAVWRRAKELMKERELELAIFARVVSPKPAYFSVELLMAYIENPEKITEMMGNFVERALVLVEAFVREGADIISFGGDTAGDNGPVISPEHFRKYYAPYMKQISDKMHAEGVFGSIASDGNLWPIIEDFLTGTGADGYEEIEKAVGMELKPLKEKFGNKICFLGNIDCRHTLCSGTIEDIEKETVECIEAGLGNGGHILMSSNSIHDGVKPENYIAMIIAHREYFGYEAGAKSQELKRKAG